MCRTLTVLSCDFPSCLDPVVSFAHAMCLTKLKRTDALHARRLREGAEGALLRPAASGLEGCREVHSLLRQFVREERLDGDNQIMCNKMEHAERDARQVGCEALDAISPPAARPAASSQALRVPVLHAATPPDERSVPRRGVSVTMCACADHPCAAGPLSLRSLPLSLCVRVLHLQVRHEHRHDAQAPECLHLPNVPQKLHRYIR